MTRGRLQSPSLPALGAQSSLVLKKLPYHFSCGYVCYCTPETIPLQVAAWSHVGCPLMMSRICISCNALPITRIRSHAHSKQGSSTHQITSPNVISTRHDIHTCHARSSRGKAPARTVSKQGQILFTGRAISFTCYCLFGAAQCCNFIDAGSPRLFWRKYHIFVSSIWKDTRYTNIDTERCSQLIIPALTLIIKS